MAITRLALFPPLSPLPLQRWALDTVHFTCHFPELHSTISTEPIRTPRTFNFICSSTLKGFFFRLVSGHCPAQWSSVCYCNITPSSSRFAAALFVAPNCTFLREQILSSRPTRTSWDFIDFAGGDKGEFEMLREAVVQKMCTGVDNKIDMVK